MATFAPALRQTFINKQTEKKVKKDLREKNKGFTFAHRKTDKFFDRNEH
jgi:hypothetical protein